MTMCKQCKKSASSKKQRLKSPVAADNLITLALDRVAASAEATWLHLVVYQVSKATDASSSRDSPVESIRVAIDDADCESEDNVKKTLEMTSSGAGEITRVGSFWVKHPELWFTQLQRQFQLGGIVADDTKYAHVVTHFEERQVEEVSEIILNSPKENKYETLKAEVIIRLTESTGEETETTSREGRTRRSQTLTIPSTPKEPGRLVLVTYGNYSCRRPLEDAVARQIARHSATTVGNTG
ncbi:hypothetical protein KM043_015679 [Ampulex compressa]|nr:hypothetical protein KM043_015679 [Ampulex compressa]